VALEQLLHEDVEAGISRFVFVAGVLELLELLKNVAHFGRVFAEVHAQLVRLHQDVAAAAQFADQHAAMVANRFRFDVLIAPRHLFDGIDVDAALMRERSRADKRLADVMAHVREIIDEHRQIAKTADILFRDTVVTHFQDETGDDGSDVAVACAFAVPIDGSLHLYRAGFDSGERVRNADAGIVVRMDADRALHLFGDFRSDATDFARHRAAVGVAEDDDIDA